MVRTPDHAFGDQLIPRGAERRYLAAQLLGNIAGSMRAGTYFRHCPQVSFLQRSQPVESHAEEALVERSDG